MSQSTYSDCGSYSSIIISISFLIPVTGSIINCFKFYLNRRNLGFCKLIDDFCDYPWNNKILDYFVRTFQAFYALEICLLSYYLNVSTLVNWSIILLSNHFCLRDHKYVVCTLFWTLGKFSYPKNLAEFRPKFGSNCKSNSEQKTEDRQKQQIN